jgi:hypothetical protein
LLNLERKRLKLEFNSHAIGTLQSFNQADQTATVTLAYQQVYNVYNPSTQAYAPKLVPYPTIVSAPVHINGGGDGFLTFPFTKGDECLVEFNDRDIDNWFAGGAGGAPATPRLHAFSDALIIVGFRSLANVLAAYDTANAVLRNRAGTVAVGLQLATALALIQTTEGGTLGTQIQDLLATLSTLMSGAATDFTALATTCTGAGAPLSALAAGFTAVASTFTTAGTGISNAATGIGKVIA